MVRLATALMIAFSFVSLSGCASKFRTYNGPEVTRVLVYKENRKMYLMHHQDVLASYDIGLGFAPIGDKQVEGDGKTPEGNYLIDRRNPNSEFHLSIGVSYPSESDTAQAQDLGKEPGGDIFIHGRPWKYRDGGQDWTAGCIAVTNKEIEDVYAMVRDGTQISIYP
ncbi:MAG: L,D-transpeptidase family protein [Pseudopelagicola sp.]|nr:L,D-transpeptidase family protein [Pseudopelagicola sp.]